MFARRGVERIFTVDLLAALCADTEAPWATWNRGKEMSPRQLAQKLGEYGIVSVTQRIGGTTAKGYELRKFEDAFARYLAPPVTSVATSHPARDKAFGVTDAQSVTSHAKPAVTRNPAPDKDCDDVTDETGVTEMEQEKF